MRQVPDVAHVTALRKALAPWIHPREDNPRQGNTSDMLTVLTEVSLEKLQRACAQQPYTHVHMLAHGKARASVGGEQFCLAFHHDQDPRQEVLVDGDQLASALRTHAGSAAGGMSHPAVVSIAACDAGNPGSVIVPGASLAHTLHEHGVPLVVALQYPLTFQGSVVMTSILYERLLWGHDPRVVLHDVRQRLRLLDSAYHDWASIVAYAGFPPDLDAQLRRARIDMAALAAAAVLARTDTELLRRSPKSLRRGHDDLSQALAVMEKVLPEPGEGAATRAKFLGRCGSLEKRRARALRGGEEEAGEGDAGEARRERPPHRGGARHPAALPRLLLARDEGTALQPLAHQPVPVTATSARRQTLHRLAHHRARRRPAGAGQQQPVRAWLGAGQSARAGAALHADTGCGRRGEAGVLAAREALHAGAGGVDGQGLLPRPLHAPPAQALPGLVEAVAAGARRTRERSWSRTWARR